ncbi:hypothetical protein VPH35_074271 [Triticum aestivum]|uniref:cytochrome b561 and DOMON domain-containing protein At5g48750-like n=1 Tax=Triticum aestivum TaxID=4565 RepID=UPI00162D3FD4|nr:cytochrome b561 and DOMON domain-containing protein At5g48750-like [Triticum aestivum]
MARLLLVLVATTMLLLAAGATAQQHGCENATFQAGRSFERCHTLPVLEASLYWTYHAANGTAEIAFRAESNATGWVAWGINPSASGGMAGSNVFVASLGGSGAVSVLTTILKTTSPTLDNTTLSFAVPVPPTAEYAAGAYTIYVTVALPGNSTQQNTVWQAGPLSGGAIMAHLMSRPNLQSVKRQDFLSG